MKILLVEDVRAVAALMAARLTALGHDVCIAGDGKLALDRFRESAPDLVLMDIEMPVMNGFEATNRIRAFEATKKWAWTPIIFLTASDTLENLVTAIEAGGDDFMAKSVPEEVLQAKMKAMGRIATLRQRLSQANRKLEEMACRDGLTGLFNRRHMDLTTDAAWANALDRARAFGLLMVDVDNFKNYNDHYGHQDGDDCLRALAAALASVIDSSNNDGLTRDAFLARYGGEEFAAIIPGGSVDLCQGIALAMLDEVRKLALPHPVNAGWGIVTVSIGGAAMVAAEGKIAALFRRADELLYRAKDEGRNRAELAPVVP